MNEKETAVAVVNDALPVFEKINDLYMTASGVMQKQQIAEAAQFDPAKRKGKARLYTIISFFVLDVIFYLYYAILLQISKILPFIGTIGTIAWFVVAIWIMIRVYRDTLHGTKKELEKNQNAKRSAEQAVQSISNDICKVFRENDEIISRIPRDYRNYDAVSYFEKVFSNQQADSLKEAMNLYDEYAHRQAMELGNARLQNIAQKQSEMLANIERLSAQTERNTRIEAGFTILNFLMLSQSR